MRCMVLSRCRVFKYPTNVRALAPLLARANVETGVKVKVRKDHRLQGASSLVARRGLIVKRNSGYGRRRLGRTRAHSPSRRLCEDSAEPKYTTRAGDSAKTRQNPSTQPAPETLQRLSRESCIMVVAGMVFILHDR